MPNPQKRIRQHYLFDILLLSAFFIPVCLIAFTTQMPLEIGGDNNYFLNKVALFSRGVLDEGYIYGIVHMAFVYVIDLVTHDLVLAAIILNSLALFGIVTGMYLLGRVFYNRNMAVFAALILLFQPDLLWLGRVYLSPSLLAIGLEIWSFVAFGYLIRRPGVVWAAVLGLLLTLGLLSRIEAVFLGILIPLAVWHIHRSQGNWRMALRVGAAAGATLLPCLVIFGYLLGKASTVSGNQSYSLLVILSTTPLRWDILSRRVSELITAILVHWPLWVWWFVLITLLWNDNKYRLVNWFFGSCIVYTAAYQFVINPWPGFPRYLTLFTPFFALLIAQAVWHIRKWAFWRYFAPALIALVLLPGMVELAGYATTSMFNYRTSQIAQDSRMLDTWLVENGWKDTEIYSLCPLTFFSRSNLHQIYRLGFQDVNTNIWWNSPANLLPVLHDQNKLLMVCAGAVMYRDWIDYFAQQDQYDERLESVGQVGNFSLYRVIYAQ